jgi:hypothetical protein
VLDSFRSLRQELDAITADVRAVPGIMVTSAEALERIEQFFLSWSNLRPRLKDAHVPKEVLARADEPIADLIRYTTGRHRKADYLRKLSTIRRSLVGQVLLEIARLPNDHSKVGQVTPGETKLLPEIPGITNDLVPNALYGWTGAMRGFLKDCKYENNVFIMVAYRKRLASLIAGIEEALTALGLNAIVARDHRLTDDLYNPIACLLCCRYGVAIFDRGDIQQTHNANIVYELAMMQTLKRKCVILKHDSLKSMPSDFLHKLYEPYSSKKAALQVVEQWWERVAKEDGGAGGPHSALGA